MIHLLTGLPGSGKSLRAVHYIQSFLQEGRPVYVWGVDGLNTPGIMSLDDPNLWESLPDGSVIVLDEAQKLWPSRRGAEPIPPVRALSEHRHQGKDFVLITQHPAMLDSYVRRLVGRHEHLVRKFGIQAAQVFSWNEVHDDPSQSSARELAEESLWAYPKDLFGQYKSATLHTVKRRVPKSLYVIAATIVIIPLLAWLAYSTISGWTDQPEAATYEPAQAEVPGLPATSAEPVPVTLSAHAEYLAQFIPRVPHVPWTAPVYDRFPVQDYPRPHCIIGGDQRIERITCRCFTQQVTPMDVPDEMCIAIARHGAWDHRRLPFTDEASDATPVDSLDNTDSPTIQGPTGLHAGVFDRAIGGYVPPEFLNPQ